MRIVSERNATVPQAITPKPMWKTSNLPDRTIQVAKQIRNVRLKEMSFFVLRDRTEEPFFPPGLVSLGDRVSALTIHGLQFGSLF